MLPDYTLDDAADMHSVGSILSGNATHGDVSSGVLLPNCTNVGFGEASGAVSGSGGTGAMARLVSVVLCDRCPSEICRTVVMSVTIPVRDNVLLRRARAVECRADHDMDCYGVAFPKRHLQIAALSGLAEDDACESVFPFDAVNVGPVYGSDTAAARSLIPWMSRHSAPFFRFPGHASVLQQGAR